MKVLLQNMLQAILDAEMMISRSDRSEMNASSDENVVDIGNRKLRTILGWVTLNLPERGHVRFLSPLFQRYATQELNFLLLLGRTLVRGYGTPATIREMTDKLCGHRFDASQVAAIAVAIERELAEYFQREFERGHGYTGVWRNVHPRSGLPRVQIMHGPFAGVRRVKRRSA